MTTPRHPLTSYVRWLIVAAVLVIVGVIALLVFLFAVPRGVTPFSQGVTRNAQRIYRDGINRGNRPDVFSKVGDSITVSRNFLSPFGDASYDLGAYDDLQPVIDRYVTAEAREGNPFTNESLAAGVGWTTIAVLSSDYADEWLCEQGESPLRCEYRVNKPSVALIMLGTNDVGFLSVDEYRANMQQIIDISAAMGVVPVISTIPVRVGYSDKVDAYNAAIYDLAETNRVPLWDYRAALETLPNRGLSVDDLHPSAPPAWYDGAAQFTPENLQYGMTVRNLTALQTLADVNAALQ
jgi:hypothetical protein